MDSANNSSGLQSSSGGGGDVEEFDSRTFFINNTSATNASSRSNNNNHLHFFDSLPFLDPSPLLTTPLPNPTTKTTPTPKNSKKRSRASRRAPTTVLTTDTSNFRAMVQEFTGIPAPPFSSSTTSSVLSSSYPRSRFDFFNPAINAGSPSLLLKPYPQRFQQAPPTSSVTNKSTTSGSNCNSSSNTNFSYLTAGGTQGPILNFQSLLQSQLAAGGPVDLGLTAQQQQPMMMPSTSAAHEFGVADHLGLAGLIGSGWGQDAGGNPTQLRQDVSKGAEVRGEGVVESWICSSD